MNIKKIGLFLGVVLASAAMLTSCTKSFCTVSDKAATLYSYEKYEAGKTYGDGEKTKEIVEQAKGKGYLTPTVEFNNFIEAKIVEEANYLITNVYSKDEKKYPSDLYTIGYARGIALFAGGQDKADIASYQLWTNFDKWVEEAKYDPTVGLDKCPDSNYIAFYKQSLNQLVANLTTCISPDTREYAGIVIEGKSWGQAFTDYGLIEGLLVYPISWLIYTFSNSFSVMGGFGTLLAVFLVTIIVRGVLILATFRQTMSQQKMTQLQPELAKIQAKYPNANTNPYEKQKMAQDQMSLYKKNKVNPFGMFIVMIFQFPIFISVWAAMQGSSILMEGEIFGLAFSATTSVAMFNFKGPWYVAWVVFILMALSQFFSMKLPQWIQKKNQKNAPKLGKNPTQDQQNKTMNIVNNVMVIMIIVMGLSLPIAMGIYWFFTALISLAQSLIMQKISTRNIEKNKFAKYKSK